MEPTCVFQMAARFAGGVDSWDRMLMCLVCGGITFVRRFLYVIIVILGVRKMKRKTDEFFFACSYPLGEGSVVLPGNWGRIIGINPDQQQEYILKERAIEQIRQHDFPERPSRLRCIFLCETLEELGKFLVSSGRFFDIKYAVRLTNQQEQIFRTDWNLISQMSMSDIKRLNSLAIDYWSGNTQFGVEVLTKSSVLIIKMIQ